MRKYLILLFIVNFLTSNSFLAWNDPKSSGKKSNKGSSVVLRAANCTPATGKKFLEFNNVSALIETGGSMWQDRSRNDAAYEVPKGSGETVIYAGALWMGGTDPNNQLRIAALTFRSGNDFWAGPLSVDGGGSFDVNQGTLDWGFADISPEVCMEYDNFYITERQEVELFNAWYECSNDPDCDASLEYPDYQIPSSILQWPGNFNIDLDYTQTYDFNLAPFYDRNSDGVYNPADGDYPWYDLTNQIDCRTSRRVTLYGDFNMWWVFNDKGNIHTETSGDPIGMEIKAQAFAFATNDEVNSMTFYNYELINRSYYTLNNTYFAVWVDSDIGCSEDDYVGCDVQRGLSYQYNADANDDGCQYAIQGYPPAIGVDFFEGPYQDNDGIDNPGPSDTVSVDAASAYNLNGIPYKGLGIGYGDGVIDNERFGMKRFVYFDRTLNSTIYGDPQTGVDFYNYMLGFWRDNTPFVYGGTGNASDANATSILTNYCFPGDSDPLNWGTVSAGGGSTVPFDYWSEQYPVGTGSSPNPQGDRRFVQAAGPFVLEPGALNNITSGVVYARAQSPDPFQSVELVRKADDKAQALFDNCFRLLNGPDSPEMSIQELDKELILYLNKTAQVESYSEIDPNLLIYVTDIEDAKYLFQGYQIYQVRDGSVDPSMLNDPNQARMIAQCDINDGVGQITNYIFDEDLLASVPTEMVDGTDEGIRHSFQVLNDAFAQGDVRLINHKKYYFMVISYGYNNYQTYDPSNSALGGQQLPFKAGRKTVSGGAITSYVGIPHITSPESGGTIQLAEYGSGPQITRLEGRGNGYNLVELTPESELDIVNNVYPKRITYKNGKGPVAVKIIDPLNIQRGDYKLWVNPQDTVDLDESYWMLVRNFEGESDTIISGQSIVVGNEQLIPQWGLSVNIEYYDPYDVSIGKNFPELLFSTVEFADSSKQWLSGVPDQDGSSPRNWIRSGTSDEGQDYAAYTSKCDDPYIYNDFIGVDDAEVYEKVIDGVWAPYRLVAAGDCDHQPVTAGGDWADNAYEVPQVAPDDNAQMTLATTRDQSDLKYLPSVDIVFTSDKSKWTRCPVLETQDNPSLSWDQSGDVNQSMGNKYGNGTTVARVYKQYPKWQASVDKDGNLSTNPGGVSNPTVSNDPNDPNYICGYGMGWFPGYAIDVTTGERLNMAYGEDSWLGNHGGNDMMFNPSAAESLGFGGFGDYVGGGKHFIYVFRNSAKYSATDDAGSMEGYDAGAYFMEKFQKSSFRPDMLKIWKSCAWVGYPILNGEYAPEYYAESPTDPSSFIATDVRVKLRVASKYQHMNTKDGDNDGVRDNGTANPSNTNGSENSWNPLYEFSTNDIAAIKNSDTAALEACDILNVVPNPYYAYSNYEFDKLDNVVKIVNLPDICSINIYTVSGTLVRTYNKDSPVTSIDWDLKNYAGIPISSGVYLIHIKVPGVCEKVLKWFGVIRPPDLDTF
ncbi:T9SS C-terminal target domain-containing protein [Bacteroidota bacterium]|nr:T9SS C-terminal target domain-containing protein [Bacteroidota bacterium]